jgi:1-phosphofructokinase family hexose kinase
MKKVLCLGLTPALQRTMLFDRLETDEVNRAKQVVESAAGKAVNTARALATLGTPAETTGFNGGETGRKLTAFLKTYGVGTEALTPMRAATRICSTLIDAATGTVTELVEEAPAPGAASVARFVRENLKRAQTASMLVISGTLPPFAGEDFYVPFAKAAGAAGVPVVIDSHRTALLRVLAERPLLAKLTVRELETTLGESLGTERQILRGMSALLEKGACGVFVTQGGKAAYLATPRGAWRFAPPKIARPLNPIGSGDCTTAGVVHALLSGKRLRDAVRFGLACGSANVESLTPADVDAARVRALARGVGVVAV